MPRGRATCSELLNSQQPGSFQLWDESDIIQECLHEGLTLPLDFLFFCKTKASLVTP